MVAVTAAARPNGPRLSCGAQVVNTNGILPSPPRASFKRFLGTAARVKDSSNLVGTGR